MTVSLLHISIEACTLQSPLALSLSLSNRHKVEAGVIVFSCRFSFTGKQSTGHLSGPTCWEAPIQTVTQLITCALFLLLELHLDLFVVY